VIFNTGDYGGGGRGGKHEIFPQGDSAPSILGGELQGKFGQGPGYILL